MEMEFQDDRLPAAVNPNSWIYYEEPMWAACKSGKLHLELGRL
jgi:hypothetical protein